jgi:hypothetical protein
MRKIIAIRKIIYPLNNAIALFLFHSIFENYKHKAKSSHAPFQQYKCADIYFHLQLKIENGNENLIQLHYAQIKRNPE